MTRKIAWDEIRDPQPAALVWLRVFGFGLIGALAIAWWF